MLIGTFKKSILFVISDCAVARISGVVVGGEVGGGSQSQS